VCLKKLKRHGFGFNLVIFLSYRPDMKITSLNRNSCFLNFLKYTYISCF